MLDLLHALRTDSPVATDLIARLSGQQMQPEDDAEQTKRQLFEALTNVLLNLAPAASSRRDNSVPGKQGAPPPLLLILEDLHWADDSSLEFPLFLARRLADYPVLLLLTYRSDEVTDTLRQLLAGIDRLRLATEFKLARLTVTDAEP